MAQILVPTSDQATGSWSNTPLWSKVDDDSTVNATGDGTTITSDNNSNPDNADFALSSGSDPGVSTGHILRARWNKSASAGHTINAVLQLWQGVPGVGTLIATLTVNNIGNTEVESTYTLTGTEANNITNYGDLYLRLSRQGDTGGNPNGRRSLVADLIEFETPDATTVFDETGKAFTITSTTTAADAAVLADTLSTTITSTVGFLDALSFDEAGLISITSTLVLDDIATFNEAATGNVTILTDDWTGTNGSAWDSGKWTTAINNGGVIDIQSNEGRLQYIDSFSSWARAESTHTATGDSELLVKTRFAGNTLRGHLYFALRHSGGWSGPDPTDAYFVERWTDSSTARIYKNVSGTPTSLGSFTWATDTNTYWLRFRVEGTALKAKIWLDGNSEPGTWNLEVTDSDLTTAGQSSIAFERASNTEEAFVDDLTVDSLGTAVSPGFTITATVTGTDSVTSGNVFDETGKAFTITSSMTNADSGNFTDAELVSILSTFVPADIATFVELFGETITSTVTGSDARLLADALNIDITSTVAGADSATFTDAELVSIISSFTSQDVRSLVEQLGFTITSTLLGADGFSLEEQLAFTINATITGVETPLLLEALALTINSTLGSADTATFVDTLNVPVVSTINFVDSAAFTDIFSETIISSFTSSDTAVLPESLSAALSASLTGADVLSGTEGLGFTIVSTIASSDVLDGAGVFDETGKAFTITSTVTLTDARVMNESFAESIVATMVSSDTAALSEQLSELITSTINSADTKDSSEALSFTINSTFTEADVLAMLEQLQVDANLTTTLTLDELLAVETLSFIFDSFFNSSDALIPVGGPPESDALSPILERHPGRPEPTQRGARVRSRV